MMAIDRQHRNAVAFKWWSSTGIGGVRPMSAHQRSRQRSIASPGLFGCSGCLDGIMGIPGDLLHGAEHHIITSRQAQIP